jgi:hypothetical protein
MKQRQNRQWQVCFLALVVLTGTTACSKHKAAPKPIPETAKNQALTPAEQAIKQQETDKHSDDYYKANNKQRVSEENSIIDDVNADSSTSKK